MKSSLIVLLIVFLSSCTNSLSTHLKKAEELTRQENYEDAIKEYKKHLKARLKLKNRKEWENPYFYYLLIGDLHLKQDNVEEALIAYDLAQKKGISDMLVGDRYRYVARWYEKKGELQKAFSLLKEHQKLDPLLFATMLDRMGKTIVKNEKNNLGSKENK